jgi:hypothetical protein
MTTLVRSIQCAADRLERPLGLLIVAVFLLALRRLAR